MFSSSRIVALSLISFSVFVIQSVMAQSGVAQTSAVQPIALHPDNPHYFIYQDEPTLLITSGEHYGAVLNLDFDYRAYLETMQQERMNYTRIFVGSYVEIPGSFNIGNNTLAPAVNRFVAPWKRTDEEGLYQGEKKFDLDEWNPEYFERLTGFIREADQRDIIVEVTFFCSTYADESWERNPFNSGNNINGVPKIDRKKSNTLANGSLTDYQKKLVAKIVTELNSFNNIFYEIQNEPWSDDPQDALRTLKTLDPKELTWAKWAHTASEASLEWQQIMVDQIVATEKELTSKHLIAQNYCNFRHSLEEVQDGVNILNFHYAWPEAVWMNYAWDRPISFDESGFAGSSDTTYLRQAWQFIVAGGSVFNNLDYSFYVGHEDGKGSNDAPGGGSTTLRQQLVYLHEFVESLDYIRMSPDFSTVVHSPGLETQCLAEAGQQYAIFFTGQATDWVKLNLPQGNFTYEFISPFTGEAIDTGNISGSGETIQFELPEFEHMVALRITRSAR
ncbi:hypothetical protein [Tunicatimonas pelagia]|uniref:hypothetical protein n=1 Tax=Tunicatimonas pelagia TaxID=931531 RepID=UPI0026666257|nr:hypothetical protein [Tunicatimonas pelagia]WKN45180.1 hypothetical protein P0M28_09430 [Tunicatimonas pelagia]